MSIRFAPLVLFLFSSAVWMLVHPYAGIYHDANLYTLQAMARLHPDSLPLDVFLRFGSQDRFTVFSPIYAGAIQLLGVDHAAALLTLLSQLALVGSGWYLARAVMPAEYATLGLVLLISVPGDYGPGRVFTCIEPFLTPRMGAEALVLAGMAAALAKRTFWCLAMLGAAVALHPVMAVAGVVALVFAHVAIPRPRLAIPLLILAAAWLLFSALAMPPGQWGRLDTDWSTLASQRSPFLFISSWQLEDWSRAAVALVTLTIGSFGMDSRLRLLCRASVLTIVSGLLLTWLACDLLRLTLFTQMQPWRWQWQGVIVAALCFPLIVIVNWKRGADGKATALLLVSAWIFGASEFSMTVSVAALVSVAFRRRKESEKQLVFWGSCALLGLAVLWRVSSSLDFMEVSYMETTLPMWLRRAMSFTHDGVAPAAVLCFAAWLARGQISPKALGGCAAIAILIIAMLLPYAWASETKQEFPQSQIDRFAPWRKIIAVSDDVFWSESPLSSWVLLNRPNYISATQTAGMIFSRQSALEMERRALSLRDVIGPQTFLNWSNTGSHLSLSPDQLKGICSLAVFNYLVTSTDLGMQPVAVMDKLKLYRCAPQARAAAAAT